MTPTLPVPRRILLIGWDAADWQHIDPLLDAGLLPTLQGLIARGVRGNLASLMPMVSPMLWTSIATGRTADQHGVHGFVEADPSGEGSRPWSSLSRRGKAIWNILHQHGRRCSTVGWWASHPAEPLRGTVVSNLFLGTVRQPGTGEWKLARGSVHPGEQSARFAPLRMQPEEVSGKDIAAFVPRAAEIDQDRDRRLESLANVLSSTVSVQAAATEIMQHEPWDFLGVYYDGIDHFCHGFMPYHPPRMDHIDAGDFEIYKDVIAGAYRFHDMMLARLLLLAGPETTVILCSDHGFLSGANRPLSDPNDPAGPTIWHREMGMLVMAGPGIRSGGTVYGASLLDITPTILTLCGLPCGADMHGKPLLDALTDVTLATLPPRIPTWDDVPGDAGLHPPGTEWGPSGDEAARVTQQLVALGYVEETTGDQAAVAAAATLEADYNLAQVHLAMGRPERAVPLLLEALRSRPWESRFIHQLANALSKAGRHRHCIQVLAAAFPDTDTERPLPVISLVLARAFNALGDKKAAWHCAARAAQALPMISGASVELAEICLELGRLDAAEHAARRAIALDESGAAGWQSLAAVCLRRHRDEEALDAGLAAVERIWQSGRSHLYIGLALARLGRTADARIALERATLMLPADPDPWRILAALPEENASPAPGADGFTSAGFLRDACRTRARQLSREASGAARQRRADDREPLTIPPLPPSSVRRATADAARPPGDKRRLQQLSGLTFTLVSGLPRSGTSLLMQMLAAGGLHARTDGIRSADDDNPEGYLEWEAIKQVASRPELFDEAGLDRLAIKCISAHIQRLPSVHRYRVIFMTRPVMEIARSQQRMIARRGSEGMSGTVESIAGILRKHRDETLHHLRRHPRAFDLLEIDYPSLVADPGAFTDRLAEFLGPELLPYPERMAAAVVPALYRNQS